MFLLGLGFLPLVAPMPYERSLEGRLAPQASVGVDPVRAEASWILIRTRWA